ncbi:unnamed protein product [Peniophora sp. CBMAI 1063]|nr:unnamed protein product [Peniophora sp. CBMAI 1063]
MKDYNTDPRNSHDGDENMSDEEVDQNGNLKGFIDDEAIEWSSSEDGGKIASGDAERAFNKDERDIILKNEQENEDGLDYNSHFDNIRLDAASHKKRTVSWRKESPVPASVSSQSSKPSRKRVKWDQSSDEEVVSRPLKRFVFVPSL